MDLEAKRAYHTQKGREFRERNREHTRAYARQRYREKVASLGRPMKDRFVPTEVDQVEAEKWRCAPGAVVVVIAAFWGAR